MHLTRRHTVWGMGMEDFEVLLVRGFCGDSHRFFYDGYGMGMGIGIQFQRRGSPASFAKIKPKWRFHAGTGGHRPQKSWLSPQI